MFALLIIAILALAFFWKFFFPLPQLLVTPDFGRSDAWHFSFPTKFFLSQSLKQNTLPLWSKKMGAGFPLFAEGQIGTLFLPNLILFKFLNPVTAYNLSLMLVVILIGWGMYLWLKILGLSPLPSLFGAVTMAFSGPVMTQLPHITLLQGFSMLPWIMSASHMLTEKKSLRWIVVLAALVSQQIFAGFPQASVVTILFAAGYVVWLTRKTMVPFCFRFGVAILLALGLSGVQILPSWEFLNESSARGGFSPADAAYFSYPLKHLITFLDPYRLGNPKLGTYPAFHIFDGSIFWENTGFIGIIPLIFFTVSLFSLKRGGLTGVTLFFFIALFLSFLFMLGSHSPLYIIYSFWPFNLFRVPSRFLWIFVTSLIIVSAMGVERFARGFARGPLAKGFLIVCVAANTVLLMKTWDNYHAIEPSARWISKPPAIKSIERTDHIYTIGSELVHNQTFLTKGWQNMTPYHTLRNTIAPDSNLLWNIPSTQVYAGRFLRRQALSETLLSNLIPVNTEQATVSAQAKKLLDIFGVTKVISAVPLTAEGFTPSPEGLNPVSELADKQITIRVYQNTTATPRAYLVQEAIVAQTFEEAIRKLQDDSFIVGKSVLVEKPLILAQKNGGKVAIASQSDTRVSISVRQNPDRSILVLTDTFYPGWTAFIDGAPTDVFPVNIRQRGVLVDAGDHTVVFRYESSSVRMGEFISLGTLFLIAVVSLLSFATSHTHPKVFLPLLYRRHNRGR